MDVWIDGVCIECGADIIEMPSDREYCDYKNMCSNEDCIEHKWHHIGDMDKLEYYIHRQQKE